MNARTRAQTASAAARDRSFQERGVRGEVKYKILAKYSLSVDEVPTHSNWDNSHIVKLIRTH